MTVHCLAMERQYGVYVDTALPFGLRSAPKLFNAVADALEWCVKSEGAGFMWHYLDDFITIGRAGTMKFEFNVTVLHNICKQLGVPLALDKDMVNFPGYRDRLHSNGTTSPSR